MIGLMIDLPKVAAVAVLASLLGACQPLPPAAAASPPPVDHEVLAFAQAACGGCHAVEHDALSPEIGRASCRERV